MTRPNVLKASLVYLTMGTCIVCGAGEITWKGGGNTSAWSDGTNWEGGNAPSAGDTAVIPDGKTAYMSSADINWATNHVSLISLPGGDSTLYITNNTEITLSVPVSGIGKFNVANNCTALTIGANNPNFTGPFYFTNSTIKTDYNHGQCFGTYNVITNFVGDGLASFYIFKGANYNNEWHIFGGSGSSKSGTRTMMTYSSLVKLCGPVYVDGHYVFAPQQSSSMTFEGGLHHAGLSCVYLYGGVKIKGDTPCDFKSTTPYFSGFYAAGEGVIELDAPITVDTPRVGGVATVKFMRKNMLYSTTGYQNGTSNAGGMRIDLNGLDQQCGTIYKYDANRQTETNSYITSATPAKLTVYGQLEWYGNQPAADNRFMSFSIRGAASLEFNGTNVIKTSKGEVVWPKMEIRNCPTKSDTTGGLCVRRGTLTLAETTSWPNLSRLETHDEGLLVLNTDSVNTDGFVFVVSNVVDSAVTIADGKHLRAKSAYVGKWLEPGEYGGADAGLDEEHTLPQLAGSGTVHVKEWGGPKGLVFIFK